MLVSMWPEIDKRRTKDGIRWGIYFARTECGRYIKIGLSHKPGDRLRAIRIAAMKRFGCTADYVGVIEAWPFFEETLHAYFAPYHWWKEWFQAAPELLRYIEHLRPHFVPVDRFYYQRIPSEVMTNIWCIYQQQESQ